MTEHDRIKSFVEICNIELPDGDLDKAIRFHLTLSGYENEVNFEDGKQYYIRTYDHEKKAYRPVKEWIKVTYTPYEGFYLMLDDEGEGHYMYHWADVVPAEIVESWNY